LSSTDPRKNLLAVLFKALVEKLTGERVLSSAPAPQLEATVVQAEPDSTPQAGVPIGREKLSHTELHGLSLRGRRFDDLNGNQTKFVSCDFSYSIFDRAYFHSASFENCKFIGCRFYDSNLRSTRFYRSDFRYATFHRTVLEPLELLASLPLEANLRRECLQNLRANAVEIGDFKSQRTFVLAEIQATTDHLFRAIHGSDSYYRQKYGTFSRRLSAALQLFGLRLSSLVWGNGERPIRIMFSGMGLILLLSLINFWAVIPRVGWSATDGGLSILRYSVDLLLGAQPNVNLRGFIVVDYALILMRYVYVGLFISVLYKTISHR
jgi:uncharacterized protein YjbI with pentapeptide repeats